MNVDTIITQLKTYAPIFGGNVAGAAEYAARDQLWMQVPFAFVIPLDDEASENKDLTGLQQVVTETFGVIVAFDNSADRRGQAAATLAVDTVKAAIFAAVLNWRPDDINAARGFRYARGGLGDFDRARLFWQFDFSIEVTLTDHDGWQLPSDPLVEIKGTVLDQPTGQTFAVFDAVPPQS